MQIQQNGDRFTFGAEVYHGDAATIERDGFTLTATIYADDNAEAPWEREDGHGPVSGWRPFDSKRPGERVISQDGWSARFYDFAEAVKIATRDEWGPGSPTEAAEADYQRLKAWCDDGWNYVGVAVAAERAGVRLTGQYANALWGIESDCGEYIGTVADDLAGEAIEQARAKLAELTNGAEAAN